MMRATIVVALGLSVLGCSVVLDKGRYQGGDAGVGRDAGEDVDAGPGVDGEVPIPDAGPPVDGGCGTDADCPGETNVCAAGSCFECDVDEDGYLAADPACDMARGAEPADCNDGEPTVHPMAPVICGDGFVNNCLELPTDFATAAGIEEFGAEAPLNLWEGAVSQPASPHVSSASSASWDGSANIQEVVFSVSIPGASGGAPVPHLLSVRRQEPRSRVVDLTTVPGWTGDAGELTVYDAQGGPGVFLGFLDGAVGFRLAFFEPEPSLAYGQVPLAQGSACWPAGSLLGPTGASFAVEESGAVTLVSFRLDGDPVTTNYRCFDTGTNPPAMPLQAGHFVSLGDGVLTSGSTIDQLQYWDGNAGVALRLATQAAYLLEVPRAVRVGGGAFLLAYRNVVSPPGTPGIAPGVGLERFDCAGGGCVRLGAEAIADLVLQSEPSLTAGGSGAALATVEQTEPRAGGGRATQAVVRLFDASGRLVPGFAVPIRYSEHTDTTGVEIQAATIRMAEEETSEPGFFGAVLLAATVRATGERRYEGVPLRGCAVR